MSFRCSFKSALLIALALGALCSVSFAQTRPCDLYAAKTPCVAAISTTRALYRAYSGPLYRVTRQSDKTSSDIMLMPDEYANAMQQDTFCAGTVCTITKLYDQSPYRNDLTPAPAGGAASGPGSNGYDLSAIADALPLTINGHRAYGVAISPGMGYRNNTAAGTPIHGQAEGVYMVTSALHLNTKCCFDFGNAEVDSLDNKEGHMDAINIICKGEPCEPNVGLDMEDGIYPHFKVKENTSFVTDMGASDGQHSYAMYAGDAQSGELTSTGVIPLPKGYQPMQQEGAIILGIGGDNSNWASGYFFEGVMTKGMPSAEAMRVVQANIVKAKYGGQLRP